MTIKKSHQKTTKHNLQGIGGFLITKRLCPGGSGGPRSVRHGSDAGAGSYKISFFSVFSSFSIIPNVGITFWNVILYIKHLNKFHFPNVYGTTFPISYIESKDLSNNPCFMDDVPCSK